LRILDDLQVDRALAGQVKKHQEEVRRIVSKHVVEDGGVGTSSIAY
jgi:hypothetical protein